MPAAPTVTRRPSAWRAKAPLPSPTQFSSLRSLLRSMIDGPSVCHNINTHHSCDTNSQHNSCPSLPTPARPCWAPHTLVERVLRALLPGSASTRKSAHTPARQRRLPRDHTALTSTLRVSLTGFQRHDTRTALARARTARKPGIRSAGARAREWTGAPRRHD